MCADPSPNRSRSISISVSTRILQAIQGFTNAPLNRFQRSLCLHLKASRTRCLCTPVRICINLYYRCGHRAHAVPGPKGLHTEPPGRPRTAGVTLRGMPGRGKGVPSVHGLWTGRWGRGSTTYRVWHCSLHRTSGLRYD